MKLAFIFPGQGSQSVGMLDAWGDHPEVKRTLSEASDALGQDVAQLISQGPAEALSLTTNTQPVMLTAGVACYRAWIAEGGQAPSVVAGHSLGEYAALVAAGVIRFEDAVPMVRFRADVMQSAVPVGTGGMAAILGLDDAVVVDVCAKAQQQSHEVVEAVNFNAPAQVVIAGSKVGVEKACELAKEAGAKRALSLPVSAPFHSSLLKPASVALEKYLVDKIFTAPTMDVVNNVDVSVVHDTARIKDALVRQAAAPVRWVESVQKMATMGVTHVVECGPGKVLTGMTKRIDSNLVGMSMYDPATLAEVKAALQA